MLRRVSRSDVGTLEPDRNAIIESPLRTSLDDVFEHRGGDRQSEEICQLRAAHAQLLARIELLEKQLGVPTDQSDSIDAVKNDRLRISAEITELQKKSNDARKEHSRLLDAADNQEMIAAKMKTLGPKATKMAAKIALQQEAKAFEEQSVAPLNEQYRTLQSELSKTAVRLTKVSRATPLATESIVDGLTRFLETGANKEVAGQIRDALNPKPGIKARDLKALLSSQLSKFLESQRPDAIPLEEWVSYLGSPGNSDSRTILKHFGIDELDRLLTAAEQYLSKAWKEKEPHGIRLPPF